MNTKFYFTGDKEKKDSLGYLSDLFYILRIEDIYIYAYYNEDLHREELWSDGYTF